MNKIFKVIWSKSKQCYVVVSEMAKNTTGKKKIIVGAILAVLATQGYSVMAAGAGTPATSNNVWGKTTPGGVAIGPNTEALGASAVDPATGKARVAPSIAIGLSSRSEGLDTITIGIGAGNSKSYGISMGKQTNVTGDYGIAIGYQTSAMSDHAVAIGEQTRAPKMGATVMGVSARGYGQGSVSLGWQALAGADVYGSGININSNPYDDTKDKSATKAIVDNYQQWGDTAIGLRAVATGGNATALGRSARAAAENAIAIGGGNGDNFNNNTEKTEATADKAVAIGYNAHASASDALAIGSKANASNSSSIAIGQESAASGLKAITMGNKSGASGENAAAYGNTALASGKNSVALGANTQATVEGGVALGAGSKANTVATAGYNPNTGRTNTFSGLSGNTLTSTWAAVSIGDGTNTRQLTGLAAGTNNTDAVNVAQLKSMNLAFTAEGNTKGDVNLTNGALNVVGDSTYITTKGNNQTLTISGKKQTITVTNGTASASAGMADANNVAQAINQSNEDQTISYKANGGTANTVKVADGLNFTNGTTTVATAGANGQVSYDLNTTTKQSITDSSTAVNRTISLGSSTGSTTAKKLASGDVKFNIKGQTGTNALITTSASGDDVTIAPTAKLTNAVAAAENAANKNLSNISSSGETVIKNLAKGAAQDAVKVAGTGLATVSDNTVGGVKTYTVDVNTGNLVVAANGQVGAAGATGASGATGSNGVATTQNVATAINDAVTKAKASTTQALADAEHKFAGDTGTTSVRKHGEVLSIKGGVTNTASLTTGNIGVVSDGAGTLNVQLAKVLSGLTSATFTTAGGNTTVINSDGVTITPSGTGASAISMTTSGINAGNKEIKGVATGTTADAAVNKAQMDAAITAAAGGSLSTEKVVAKTLSGDNNLATVTGQTGTARGETYEVAVSENAVKAVAQTAAQDAVKVAGTGLATVSDATAAGVKTYTVNVDEGKLVIDDTTGKLGANGATQGATAGKNGVATTQDVASVVNSAIDKTTQALADAKHNFAGDDATVISRKHGEQLNIKGGASTTATDLTSGNIAVVGDTTTGTLNIKMAKALTGLTSATYTDGAGNTQTVTGGSSTITDGAGHTTTMTKGGLSTTDGTNTTTVAPAGVTATDGTHTVTLGGSGINAGGAEIKNVGKATTDDAAVNKKQMDDAVKAATDSISTLGDNKVSLGSDSGTTTAKKLSTATGIKFNIKGDTGTNALISTSASGDDVTIAPTAKLSAAVTAAENAANKDLSNLNAAGDTYIKNLAKTAASWNVETNGAGTTAVAGGESVNFVNGDNIVITNAGRAITIGTAKNVSFDKVTVGGVVLDKTDGINAGGKEVKGIADGTAADSAVSKGQMETAIANAQTAATSTEKVIAKALTGDTNLATVAGQTGTAKGETYEVAVSENAVKNVAKSAAQEAVTVTGTGLATVSDNTAGGVKTYTVNVDEGKLVLDDTTGQIGANGSTQGTTAGKNGVATTQNVATAINDAITKSNANTAQALADAEHKFDGDTGTTSVRKHGEVLSIKGGVSNATDLTTGNIGVVSDGAGTLNIRLAKVLSGLTSATYTDGSGNTQTVTGGSSTITDGAGNITTITKGGVTTTDGTNTTTVAPSGVTATDGTHTVTLGGSGINAGGTEIKNIGKATTDDAAVNKKQMDDAVKAATDSVSTLGDNKVSLGSDAGTTNAKKLSTTGGITFNIKGDTGTNALITTSATGDDVTIAPTAKLSAAVTAAENAANKDLSNLNAAGDTYIKNLAKTAASWNVETNGAGTTAVAGGESVNFVNGDNIVITNAGRAITIGTAKNVSFDKVTVGGVVLDKTDGINAGGKEIKGIADGTAADSAVSKGQMETAIANAQTAATSTEKVIAKALTGDTNLATVTGQTGTAKGETYEVAVSENAVKNVAKAAAQDAVTVTGTGLANVTDSTTGGVKTYTVNVDEGKLVIDDTTGKVGAAGSTQGTTAGKNGIATTQNVATAINDAVTKANAATAQALADAEHKFDGDTGTTSVRKHGEVLSIKGGVTTPADLTTGNIGVVSDGAGTLNIRLAKALTGLTSATYTDGSGNTQTVNGGSSTISDAAGNSTVVSKGGVTTMDAAGNTTTTAPTGVTVTPAGTGTTPISVTTSGISAGNKEIKNVANGTTDDAAVNKKQMDDAITKATADATHEFGGDDATVVTRKHGEKLTIKGGATTTDADLTSGNIAVIGDATSGALNIKLAKALTGLTSATFTDTSGNTTTVTGGSTTIADNNGNTQTLAPTKSEIKDNNGVSTVTTKDGVTAKDASGNITSLTKGGLATTDGTNTTSVAPSGVTATNGTNTVALTGSGIDAGGTEIKNVGKATTDDAAVNKKQMDDAITKATADATHEFGGDDATVVTRKHGEKLTIKGGATTTDADLTSGNIAVIGDATSGALNIKLAKALTGLTSATFTDTSGNTQTLTPTKSEIKDTNGVSTVTTKDGVTAKDASGNTTSLTKGGLSTTDGTNKTTVAPTGITATDGSHTVKVEGSGIDAGNTEIKHIAAGTSADSAVNKGQMDDAITKATADATHEFAGDDATVISRKHGEQLNIKGGASTTATDLTSGNIAVVGDTTSGTLNIKMAKALTGLTSATYTDTAGNTQTVTGGSSTISDAAGNSTVVSKGGVTTTDAAGNTTTTAPTGVTVTPAGAGATPISVTTSGISAGNKEIKNVGKATTDDAAVNKKQMDEAVKAASDATKALGNNTITLGGDSGSTTTAKTLNTTGGIQFNIKGQTGTDALITTSASGDDVTITPTAKLTAAVTAAEKSADKDLSNLSAAGNTHIQDLAKSAASWNVQTNGKGTTAVVGGDTVNFINGDNIAITNTGHAITIGTAKNVSFDKVTVGGMTLDKNGSLSGISSITGSGTGAPTMTFNSPNGNNPANISMDSNLDMGGHRITGVGPAERPTDAVNKQQVDQALHSLAGMADSAAKQYASTAGANAAALAALKPIQYDPLEPTQIMAGVGNYKSQTAVALGMAHYTNENTMFNIGVSLDSHDSMVNAGVTHKFGYSPEKKAIPDRYKGGPISSIYVMQDEMKSLLAKDQEKDAVISKQAGEIDTLRQQNEDMQRKIDMILAKLK